MKLKTQLFFTCVWALFFCQLQAQNAKSCDCSEIGINKIWADSSGVTCYKIPVNLIYNDISKEKKEIAVIRAKSSQKSNLLPIVYLHGGPGIATLGVAQKYLSHSFWKKLREKHDIIMMDYSGTGYSGPYLCDDIQQSIASVEASEISEEEKHEKKIALFMNCRDSLQSKNIPINTFSSFQIAADTDEVREKLGIKKWNVYGVSYGSHVAMQYMRHFEKNINTVILDSPFPPNVKNESFAYTMKETLTYMQNVINKDPKTAKMFPDIISDFASTAERLNKKPLKMKDNVITGSFFAQIMVFTFYKTKLVPLIPIALKEFASGNDEAILEWFNSQYINDGVGGDAYGKENIFHDFAINGYEWKPRTYENTHSYISRKYPYLAALSKKDYIEISYAFRPEHPDASYYEPIKSNLPTLVLNCEFDPGCPISYGYATIEKMTNAKMIIVPNASHSAATYNDCTQNLISDFIDNPQSINTKCIEEIKKLEFVTTNFKEELAKRSTIKK